MDFFKVNASKVITRSTSVISRNMASLPFEEAEARENNRLSENNFRRIITVKKVLVFTGKNKKKSVSLQL